MTKYREILRLASLGFSNRSIALSVPCSRNTVAKVLKMAQELKLCWPLQDNQTDEVLEKLFYPQLNNRPQKREPDYDYIRKELLRNGVSKKLLWTEYMEACRANGDEPLMYSQFCYHIQQDDASSACPRQKDIEKAHLFSLFVAKTSAPAKCRKIKDTSVSYWLNRHL